MNENITPNVTPVEPTVTTAPNPTPNPTAHKYWALILALMGICLAVAMYFVYKNSISDYQVISTPTIENTKDIKAVQPTTETSGSIEQDKGMQTHEVADDILKELDDVEKTDASASFDTSQASDL